MRLRMFCARNGRFVAAWRERLGAGANNHKGKADMKTGTGLRIQDALWLAFAVAMGLLLSACATNTVHPANEQAGAASETAAQEAVPAPSTAERGDEPVRGSLQTRFAHWLAQF